MADVTLPIANGRKMIPLMERFLDKVELIPFSECWWWNAGQANTGYGQIYTSSGPKLAHRVSYELHKGEIPQGMQVCHTCDERQCVNPDHLWLGTNYDNVQDMVAKGRCKSGDRHYAAKLTEDQVKEIRTVGDIFSQSKLARKYNVSQGHICMLLNNKVRVI